MFWESGPFWLSAILASSVPIVLFLGLQNRTALGRSPGWQFIRFSVLSISIPIIAVLALNDALSGAAVALIGGAMAYAFNKKDEKDEKDKKNEEDK